MEVLVIFGALIGLAILANIFFWFAELVENTKLGSQFGNDVATLTTRIDGVRVPEMTKDFNALQTQTRESIGRLAGPGGKILNVCPQCGSPMCSRRVGRGFYASCTKQGCFGSQSFLTINGTLDELKLI